MLVSHRGCVVPELGSTVMDHSVLHPRFRMVVSVRRNVTIDDRLFHRVFPRRLDPDRIDLLVALEGAFELRRSDGGSTLVDEGNFVLERRDRDWATRVDGPSSMLVVEWGDDVFGRVESESGGALPRRTLAALRATLSPLLAMDTPEPVTLAASQRALAILRAAGVRLPPYGLSDLREPVPTAHAALARAVDRAVADFVRSPRSTDLEDELGWSSRHVTRRLTELHRRYGFNATGGVRDVLGRWRIYAGAALMTAPNGTTEAVARLMGYASCSALCKAFANHQLPSPGNVRGLLRAIG